MRWVFVLCIIVLGGCQDVKAPPIQLREFKSGPSTSLHGEAKPAYREITDEFGVYKGWQF